MNHYLFWAMGKDHPGFVAGITKILFDLKCNLEDSSMMRLGSEFSIFLIVASKNKISETDFSVDKNTKNFIFGLKKIPKSLAQFVPPKGESYIVRVYGQDRPGIVYGVTQCLAKHAFNITDLSTHRTTKGPMPGYILILEGELLLRKHLGALKSDLKKLSKRLRTNISIDPLTAQSL